jgi:hypothetical protein
MMLAVVYPRSRAVRTVDAPQFGTRIRQVGASDVLHEGQCRLAQHQAVEQQPIRSADHVYHLAIHCRERGNPHPHLVVVPLSTLPNCERELVAILRCFEITRIAFVGSILQTSSVASSSVIHI